MLHQLDLFGGEPVKIEGKALPPVSRGAKTPKEKKPVAEIQEPVTVAEEPVPVLLNQPDLFSELESGHDGVVSESILAPLPESTPIEAIQEPDIQKEQPAALIPIPNHKKTNELEKAGKPTKATKQKKVKPQAQQTEPIVAAMPVIPPDELLFSKQYYPISEVALMFGVNISLLRYWEKEFDIIKPRKNRKGDRLFRPADIKNLKLIHFLLKEKKYTIKGAKDFLKKGKSVAEKFEAVAVLKNIRTMLMELKTALS